jgi:hypothetical protein
MDPDSSDAVWHQLPRQPRCKGRPALFASLGRGGDPVAQFSPTRTTSASFTKGIPYMKPLLACLALGSLVTFGSASLAGAVVTPKAKATTIRFYGKDGYSGFTSSTGKPVGENTPPVVGDQILQSVNLYRGSNTHHSQSLSATASLHCVVTSVSATSLPANCEVVVSIGDSMLISLSVQNFAAAASTMVFPVVTGTGVFNKATGRIVVFNLGNPNTSTVSNAVIQVTTP